MNAQLLALAGPIRTRVAISTGLGLLVTACYGLQGIALAQALAVLFAGGAIADITPWIIAFAGIVLLRGLLLWCAEIAAQTTAQRTKEHLRARLLSHLAALGPGVTLRQQTGDLQAVLVAGVEALEGYYSRYMPAIFIAILGCGGVLAVLAWVDWPSALLLGFFVTAFPIADRLWLRWRMPKSSGVFAAMGAFGAYLLDSLQGIVTLKAFDATTARRKELASRAAALRQEAMATLAVTLMRTGLTGFITLIGVALVLSFNSWRTAAGLLTPVALFTALFLVREAFRPLDRLEKEFHTAWAASGAATSISDFLALMPNIHEPTMSAPIPTAHGIAFDNVSFAYEADGAKALSAVSFAIKEKEFVALVGPSGSGKSTIISLLLRFFDPTSGHIRIGGTDIRDLSLENLRSLVSVVSQDTYLFHGTIEDNLRIAKPDATMDEIYAAAIAAHIDEFIFGLPKGYATEIGERGAHLSGGQRQRLSIARALLKNAPILILDEATSNVDPRSERAIQDALDALVGRRTTLVIAHRLSTIRKADRILVIEDGRIVEEGDHHSLEQNGQIYSRLMAAQGEAA
ncbi:MULTISPECIES: ABC transporter ATP-binding protein [unclassified Beijerinckia]|uniref:ABC transporter ATP-binding protein/permease n=1 Tax=unclassified Beijerinckia TaxID=2638183 RepID=UPI00089C497C|nr:MULTISPECIES: ABC transporter ATP-binding protein [unclassified Beijerinckia]MDH7794931.1 ATP-binding cassette subfamily C protein CydD [Beijerinckia sp. GAS462]SEB80857.1 ATP-binding cassette, subfamily C, CydCD [Beijerinckia sp. 28-YEA-48]